MKTRIFLILLVGLLVLGFVSCPKDYFVKMPECIKQEAFQENLNPISEEYQSEVLVLLRDKNPDEFRYKFETFLQEDGNIFMLTNFRNNEFCFDAKLLVNKWDKLGGMKRTNGKSYPKELYELKWKIDNINGLEQIVYLDMHRIID